MNQIVVYGNVGADAQLRMLPSGEAVANFDIADTRKVKRGGTQVKETAWFRVSVFGQTAEAVAQYVKKGDKVLVTGRINFDPNTGGPKTFARKDGTTGAAFEVVASNVEFGGNGQREQAPQETEEDIPL